MNRKEQLSHGPQDTAASPQLESMKHEGSGSHVLNASLWLALLGTFCFAWRNTWAWKMHRCLGKSHQTEIRSSNVIGSCLLLSSKPKRLLLALRETLVHSKDMEIPAPFFGLHSAAKQADLPCATDVVGLQSRAARSLAPKQSVALTRMPLRMCGAGNQRNLQHSLRN